MRVLDVDTKYSGGLLVLTEQSDPSPAFEEVIIQVEAVGVNRADTSQRKGNYGPPPGAPKWPGLECAGVIREIGQHATRWQVGDRVCALVAGGAYAEQVAVHESQLLAVPDEWSMIQAAAFLEAAATAWSNLIGAGHLTTGETVLVHGGSSGVGSFAIQIAKLSGAKVLTTVGTEDKAKFCLNLGADEVILYRNQDVTARVMQLTENRGVDLVLDIVGGATLQQNIDRLALDGRIVVVGVQGGDEAVIDLRSLLAKRGVVTGSLLRRRTPAEKALLLEDLRQFVVPAIVDGRISIPIDSVYSFTQAMDAHKRMESSAHCGKIVLVP